MNQSLTELNAEALYQKLLTQIREALANTPKVAVVGIRSGGAWIAERVVDDLKLDNPPGFIDVSFTATTMPRRDCQPKSNLPRFHLTWSIPPFY